jgi:hypothetical protein
MVTGVGNWYNNGRLLIDAEATVNPFKWGSADTTNYALFAALFNTADYGPNGTTVLDNFNDENLATLTASGGEPAADTGYMRQPLTPIKAVPVTLEPTAPLNYIIYPVNTANVLAFAVNANKTLTAGLIVFYWDFNVKNSLTPPATAYYPSGANHADDNECLVLGYAEFIDSQTGLNTWTPSVSSNILYNFEQFVSGGTTYWGALKDST